MKIHSFPGLQSFRLPLWARDEDGGEGGGGDDDPFAEQPGDREAEGGGDEGSEGDDGGAAAGDDGDAGEGDGAGDGDGGDQGGDEGAEGDGGAEASGEGDGEGDAPPPKKSWKDRQIIKLRQQLKAARGEGGKQTEAATEGAASTVTGGEGEDLVPRAQAVAEARAEFERGQRFKTINERSDAMYDSGATAFPKTWKTRVDEAAEALGEDIAGRPEFLETLTELPNAAAVYHELTGDLDEMERVLNLPPAKMGMELARLSGKLTEAKPKPKSTSKAPPPIKPLDRTTTDELSLDDPNLSQDEFNRRMDKLDAQKYAERRA